MTQFEAGMSVILALNLKKDVPEVGATYESIEPRTSKEKEILYFRATEFFTVVRDQEKATYYLGELEKNTDDQDLKDTATVEFECTFDRCALALGKLQRLSIKFPNSMGYRSLLGYAYADRRQFKEAAEQFDIVVQNEAVDSLDSTTALVGIVSYANSKQKDKARRLYEIFTSTAQPQPGINEENFAKMREIVDDTSGKEFLFSDWPINDQLKSNQ